MFLCVILGHKLLQKPLLDINLIIDSINNNSIDPINHVNDKYLFVYRFIRVVILAPILEELFFRKIIFKGLLKKYSFVISVTVSSLLFAMIHIQPHWQNVLVSFIFGVICCYIYISTKNILYPILFHSIGNLVSFIISINSNQVFAFEQELNYNWIYWTAFVMGIGLTIFGLKKIRTAGKSFT